MSNKNQYKQVGWWVSGLLKSGWDTNYQANFADMTNKFNQLGLYPLVKGLSPNVDLGIYFSMAEFDYIQLLTVNPPEGTQNRTGNPLRGLASYSIVSYAIWMASQSWSSFSPIPITQLQGIVNEKIYNPSSNTNQTYFPTGWYFLGSFSKAWYANLKHNYVKAMKKRENLGIHSLSPLYFCQSSFYDCVQMAQAPYDKHDVPDVGIIQEYVSWFNEEGFGNLKSIPFMTENLISEAIEIGGKTP